MHRPLVAGLLLGIAIRFAHALPEQWHWLAKVGVPWLVVAFMVGAAARGARAGAIHGAICLVVAIVVYYAIPGVVFGRPHHSPLGLWWLWVALPGGAAFGALGAVWRSGRAVVPIAALLTASLAAEALIFALWRMRDPLAAPALFAMAVVTPLALAGPGPGRRRAAALGAALTVAGVVAEVAVTRALGYVS